MKSSPIVITLTILLLAAMYFLPSGSPMILIAAFIYLVCAFTAIYKCDIKPILRQRKIIRYFSDGQIDRFLEETDRFINETSSAYLKRKLMLNKSAGLAEKGAWAEVIGLLGQIDFEKLDFNMRALYLNNILYALLMKGDFEEAKLFKAQNEETFASRHCSAGLRIVLDYTLACYDFFLGDPARAETMFLHMLEIIPKSASVSYFLGLIALKRGDRETAINYFNQASDLGRNTFIPERIKHDLESQGECESGSHL